jgi:hypothetical protein
MVKKQVGSFFLLQRSRKALVHLVDPAAVAAVCDGVQDGTC